MGSGIQRNTEGLHQTVTSKGHDKGIKNYDDSMMLIYSEARLTRTAGDHQQKFELCVMLSLCYEATVASPFCSSVFHFLAKISKICKIFFSCEENNEIKPVTQKRKHIHQWKRQFDGTNRGFISLSYD